MSLLRKLGGAFVALALFILPAASYARHAAVVGSLQMFSSERVAHRRCPRDAVVWLNTRTGIYHEAGMRWYGRTKQGAYVCKAEADAAGDRDTRNGQ